MHLNKLLKYYTSVVLLLSTLSSLTSCYNGCALGFYGKVEEKSTQNTIDSVRIDIYHDGVFYAYTFTDTAGNFEADSKAHSVFLLGKCKSTKLKFSKDGYKTFELSSQKGGNSLIVQLEKQ